MQRCAAFAAVSGVPVWFAERQLAAAEASRRRPLSPNDRPGIALVGAGGQGTNDARNAANWGDVRVVCDVDRKSVV